MGTGRTSKETNELKWKRMRLIIDEVKNRPLSLFELEELVSKKAPVNMITKRTVQNYMAELKALGLVVYNKQERIYEHTENKKVFKNKYNYNIALKHSKNLMFSTKKKQRFDQMDPYFALEMVLLNDQKKWTEKDDFHKDLYDFRCVYQHLRTGYPKLNPLIDKYREQNKNKKKRPVGCGPYLGNLSIEQRMEYFAKEIEKQNKVNDSDALLVGKLYFIFRQVKEGIPLQGNCDYCPDKKVSIK
jgi:hypothetical protein